MKANEAPEKIYIQAFDSNEEDVKFERLLYFDDIWTEEPEPGQENIEYTRTDAFIEKACEWLQNNINDYIFNDGKEWISDWKVNVEEMLDDFKNYMKGE